MKRLWPRLPRYRVEERRFGSLRPRSEADATRQEDVECRVCHPYRSGPGGFAGRVQAHVRFCLSSPFPTTVQNEKRGNWPPANSPRLIYPLSLSFEIQQIGALGSAVIARARPVSTQG